jgi:hypothetical protein
MTNNNKPRTIPPHSVPINDPTETEEQEVTGLAVGVTETGVDCDARALSLTCRHTSAESFSHQDAPLFQRCITHRGHKLCKVVQGTATEAPWQGPVDWKGN